MKFDFDELVDKIKQNPQIAVLAIGGIIIIAFFMLKRGSSGDSFDTSEIRYNEEVKTAESKDTESRFSDIEGVIASSQDDTYSSLEQIRGDFQGQIDSLIEEVGLGQAVLSGDIDAIVDQFNQTIDSFNNQGNSGYESDYGYSDIPYYDIGQGVGAYYPELPSYGNNPFDFVDTSNPNLSPTPPLVTKPGTQGVAGQLVGKLVDLTGEIRIGGIGTGKTPPPAKSSKPKPDANRGSSFGNNQGTQKEIKLPQPIRNVGEMIKKIVPKPKPNPVSKPAPTPVYKPTPKPVSKPAPTPVYKPKPVSKPTPVVSKPKPKPSPSSTGSQGIARSGNIPL